jgi:tetratricopeptide (TPR) repeat protein
MSLRKLCQTLVVALLLGTFASGGAFAARKSKEEKAAPMFPQATRSEPKAQASQRLTKQLQAMIDASQEGESDKVIELADAVIAHKSAGTYDKALAYQAKGFAFIDKDDYVQAMQVLKLALDSNGLPNDSHYQIMFQLGQMHMAEEQYAEALEVMDRFLTETKSEKPEHLAVKGNILYRLERYDEAAALLKRAIAGSDKPQDAWSQLLMASYFDQDKPLEAAKIAEEILAKNPGDKKMLMNLSSIYADADMYDKAIAVLEDGRAKGLLTEERDYRQLYALYLNAEGKEAQGVAVIEEGLQKGILKPNAEVYIALGQAYYFSDKITESVAAYRKALPYAKDGEPALNLSRVLTNEEDYAGAKAAAQEALKKGVKRPGDAWMVIGRAEFGLGNKAGLVAAYKEAAKYPETKQQASEWLSKNASK